MRVPSGRWHGLHHHQLKTTTGHICQPDRLGMPCANGRRPTWFFTVVHSAAKIVNGALGCPEFIIDVIQSKGEKMKRFLNMLFLLVLSAFIYGHSSTASAVTVYTSEADFGAALDSFYLEEFDDLVEGDDTSSLERGPVNGFSYTITAGNDALYHMDSSFSTNGPAESLVFNFTGDSVTAFGGFLWPTDFNCENQVAGMDIEIHFAGGDTETYSIENAAFDTFTGFTSSEAITSILFSENGDPVWTDGSGLFVSADHIYAGAASPVPVPGAVWLLASGLVGLAGLRRKAHKQFYL